MFISNIHSLTLISHSIQNISMCPYTRIMLPFPKWLLQCNLPIRCSFQFKLSGRVKQKHQQRVLTTDKTLYSSFYDFGKMSLFNEASNAKRQKMLFRTQYSQRSLMNASSQNFDRIVILLLNPLDGKIKSSIVEIPKSSWWDVTHVNNAATASFKMPVRVVRCLTGDTNEIVSSHRTYAVEATASPFQDGKLDSIALDLSADCITALQKLLDARRTPLSSWLIRCEPWTAKAFQNKVEIFVREANLNLNMESTTWLQRRCWARAYVYEIKSNGIRYFFKACPPTYASEPELSQYLSKRYPDFIAQIKSIDVKEGFLLSQAFEGNEVAIGDIKSFEAAACNLARIQVAESKEISKLASLGVIVLRYEGIENSILGLLNDDSALMVGKMGGLSRSECNTLKEKKEFLISALKRLQRIGIPFSLEHGDFRAANILCTDNHACCIIDWSEAAVNHPFFSLAQLLDEEDHAKDTISAINIKNQIASAYFKPWLQAGFSKAHLVEALELARLLMPLIKAIERRERLIPNLVDAKSWRFSVAYWVKRFLLRL